MIKKFFLILLLTTNIYAFVATGINIVDDVYKAVKLSGKVKLNKSKFINNFIKNPSLYQNEFKLLSHKQKVEFLTEIAVQKGVINFSRQIYYVNKFNKVENGDKLLLSAIQNGQNLNKVLRNAKQYIPLSIFEKKLLKISNESFVNGKTVFQRDELFRTTSSNKLRMRQGKAPIGKDGYPVELHHIKQKNRGLIVEMIKQEHLNNSSILHRYKGKGESEIIRNKFDIWRKNYWKKRADEL